MPSERLPRFAWSVLGLNILVILWGAYVRATGAGAGCGSHWPMCNGEIVPREPRLETLVEFTHRLTSGLALLAVAALLIWVWRRFPAGDPARHAAVAAMIFMLGEAAVGAALVLFGLVADNATAGRAWVVGFHLVNTLFLLAALALTARLVEPGPRPTAAALRQRELWPYYLGLAGLALVGASGAVSALGDTLFPSRDLPSALVHDFSPGAHFLIRLRVFHPLLAVGVGLYLLFFVRPRPESRPGPAERRWSGMVALLVFLQFAAGTLNVVLLAPVWLQLGHLLLADLLLVSLVLLLCERSVALAPTLGARQ